MRINKKESAKIGRLAKSLRQYFNRLDVKYFDNEALYSPDIYAEDYDELLKLKDSLSWWTD